MISEYNRRVTLKSWGTAQDEGGGLEPAETASYTIWAKVEDKSGQPYTGEGQRTWNYDYKITFRYEKSRPVSESMTVDYASKRLTINSISYSNEGKKEEVILKCSK